jgi:hypothetical protein
MKRNAILISIVITTSLLVFSCSEGPKKDPAPIDIQDLTKNQPETHGTELKESDITLTTPLDQAMVATGKASYELKCMSCHRLTEEKLVGPGWKGVTQKRQPLWIMNMITNVDMMLETDAEAQKLLEQCLVRMPNQNINKDEARNVLEFMRNNDGVK